MRHYLIVFLFVVSALILGCGYFADLSPGDDAKDVVVPSGSVERHDVAITAVDTDPAWMPRIGLSPSSVSLLAVVENKGNVKERAVVVEATLFSGGREKLLLHGAYVINELSPGQSEVVRFGPFSSIPASPAYLIEIEVKPVPGEDNLGNNVKIFQQSS